MSKTINIFRLGINCDMPDVDKKYLGEINIKMYKMLTYMRNLRWVTLNSIANLAMIRTLVEVPLNLYADSMLMCTVTPCDSAH